MIDPLTSPPKVSNKQDDGINEEADHVDDLEIGSPDKTTDDYNQCSICMCPFEEGDELKVLNCTKKNNEDENELEESKENKVIEHTFHQECIT